MSFLGAKSKQGMLRLPRLSAGFSESNCKALVLHSALLLLSVLFYVKTWNVLAWALSAYFCANIVFLLALILFAFAVPEPSARAPANAREPPTRNTEGATGACSIASSIQGVERPEQTFQLKFKKKASIPGAPSRFAIKKYDDYKHEFGLSKEMEKMFRAWVLSNVIAEGASPERVCAAGPGRAGTAQRPLTKSELEILGLISTNGFICYDKSSDVQSKALFKAMYNYFNARMPACGSYYTNPMDEFVFDDINKVKISTFGLLIEDTESLLESKKLFNVYFLNKNSIYDTEGDVLLAFLLLLIHADLHSGGYFGQLSLRPLAFLRADK